MVPSLTTDLGEGKLSGSRDSEIRTDLNATQTVGNTSIISTANSVVSTDTMDSTDTTDTLSAMNSSKQFSPPSVPIPAETTFPMKSSSRKPTKKRKYSRSGCLECKRRKIKCDEKKPECWNCRRLNKVCTYENLVKFNRARSFTVNRSKLVNFPVSAIEGSLSSASRLNNSSTVPPSTTSSVASSSEPFLERPSILVRDSSRQIPQSNNPSTFQLPDPSQMVFNNPIIPVGEQNQINENLLNGASNVISDLNDMIQHFGFDFGTYSQHFDNNMFPAQRGSCRNSVPEISPVPASYPSENVVSNSPKSDENYVKRLTKTKVDSPVREESQDECFAASSASVNSMALLASVADDSTYIIKSPTTPSTSAASTSAASTSTTSSSSLVAYPSPPLFILMSDSPSRFEYLHVLNNTINISDLVSLAKFFNWKLTSLHINYLKIFVTKIHMNFLPFTTSFLNNAYISCFLSQAKPAPHLLFALLAIAAKYKMYQVARTITDGDSQREKLTYHRKFRSYYLSSCLKSLSTIMHSKPQIFGNIESLLLTILVLASDCSGNKGSEWRAHLKGAKDLLLKYCKFRPMSLALVIVWLWFYSMETLAGLTAYNGGTIHDFDELQDFLEVIKSTNSNVGMALKKFGFLFGGYHVDNLDNPILQKTDIVPVTDKSESDGPKGAPNECDADENYIVVDGHRIKKLVNYDLYIGYNDDVIDIINDIVVAVESLRKFSTKQFDSRINDVLNSCGNVRNEYLVSLVAKISKARSFTIVGNKAPFRILIQSPYHPLNTKGYHYNNPTGVNVVLSGYIHNTNKNTCSNDDNKNWYSWFDLSQQLYVDATLLKVLTGPHFFSEEGLSIKSSLVQGVVERMMSGLHCLITYRDSVSDENLESLRVYYNEPEGSNDDESNDPENESADDVNDSENSSGLISDFETTNDDAPERLHIKEEYELRNDRDIRGGNKRFKVCLGKQEIQFEKYLYYQFDNRLVMVQWPLFMCGLCCIEPKQKLIIDCCFNALMSLGVGSSKIMLTRLVKVWTLQKRGKFDYSSQHLFDNEDDSVPFT
ncbi:hypothetical protein FOA43_002787 [Brettanomyces nanus]|uniref:Zn(2)-C6 fungal-type domain-containing protein n=1 Tax=Eeniella nana TaxID=13502 RepID=A0A875S3G5_EENNA|nr:uncharacterized protein FOA43_002787 [Brettanomyces nanus]QPG75433.1 hypothetical protein FOA43_002787 [Brettanomyces nanus]